MRQTGKRACLLHAAYGLYLFLLAHQVAASHVRVEGRYELRNYKPSGEVSKDVTNRFEALIDRNVWKLRVFHTRGGSLESIGSDDEIFQLSDSTSVVTPGLYPYAQPAVQSVPWLAFCSERYFAKSDYSLMPILGDFPNHNPLAHGAIAAVTFLPDSKLPASIRFVTDLERLKTATSSPYLDATRIEPFRPTDYNSGETLAEYRVFQHTNLAVGEDSFPVRFEYKRFSKAPSSTNQLFLCSRIEGFLHTIETINSSIVIPTRSKVDVVDRRLANKDIGVDYVQYRFTNDGLPAIPPEVQVQFVKDNLPMIRARLKRQFFPNGWRTDIFRIALPVITVAAIAIWLGYRRLRRR
jgi:hypothetical protein